MIIKCQNYEYGGLEYIIFTKRSTRTNYYRTHLTLTQTYWDGTESKDVLRTSEFPSSGKV